MIRGLKSVLSHIKVFSIILFHTPEILPVAYVLLKKNAILSSLMRSRTCIHVNHKHGGGQHYSEDKCVF